MSLAPRRAKLLRDQDLRTIAEIGHYRKPLEACGVLLDDPHRGDRVFELPNRVLDRQDEFAMKGEDLIMVLQGYAGGPETMTIWHTHPGGQLGPSSADLQERPGELSYLVVTLYEDPRDAKATWY
jgi:proteasome lid subunit RPN8/RPN11